MNHLAYEDGRVVGKRGLRFAEVNDAAREAEQLLASGYTEIGEWSLAENCAHLRKTFEYSVDGFPVKLPLWMRIIIKIAISKKKVFREGFKPGIKLSGRFAALLPGENLNDAEEVAKLKKAITRFQQSNTSMPSPVLGTMSFEDWKILHCRHCEHHLGMLRPKG
ncbi:hypothetical protein KS4_34060 [Poriferisphaera corsica]|uniref:DUF1569 domain-containing protein n=1 Tax=Poriferisphaera corsica TaxID=2528020 RepID=A0A517YYN9_9BACT|nr:DUF1569 domain-containing protein [Poriferisphaera corsica]QDU35325.1 hypothetical protein KS4_34060 [Poriferisphaera corsica]